MNRPALASLALLAALPLSGCISLGAKPPPRLMTLTASSPREVGAAITAGDAQAVAIARPGAIPPLATQRVLVTDGPTEIAYLKGGLWAAQPADLFRSLLSETVTARTGRVVTDQRLPAIQPDLRLSGQLSAFGLDGPGMAVTVTFDATLGRAGSDQVQSRRFSARAPVTSEQPAVVAAAVNQAANQVAADVADWIGR